LGDEIEEDERERLCSMLGRDAYNVLVRKLKERNHLEDVGVYRNIIFDLYLTEIGWEDVNWIHLAQDRYQWEAPSANFFTS
jgi:hypothetical protein